LAAATHRQAGYWRDTIDLFEHARAVTERNWFAHSKLGGSYAAQGDLARGMEHMREALRLNPRYALKGDRPAPAARPPGHPPSAQPTLPPGHPRL
jgi:tetratricopeptide (TPR) repeat protein